VKNKERGTRMIEATGHEEQIYVYPTKVMEIAAMLLCHEEYSMQKAEAAPVPADLGPGRMARVTWFICCPSKEEVEGLVEAHHRSREGIMVGVKHYERVRSMQVVRAMKEAQNELGGSQ